MASNSCGKERPKKAPSFLSRIPQAELKTLCVAIKRPNLKSTGGRSLPIQRNILNLADLIIHYREDEGTRPIFDREDIVCNIEDVEERFVVKTTETSRNENRNRSRSHSSDSEDDLRRKRRTGKSYSPAGRKDNYGRQSKLSSHRSPQRPSKYRSKSPPTRSRKDKRSRSRSRQPRSREYSPLKPGEYNPRKMEQLRSYKYEKYRYRSRSKSPRQKSRSKSPRGRSRSPRYQRCRSKDRSSDYHEQKGSSSYVRSDRYRRSRSKSPNRHGWSGISAQGHIFPEYCFENPEYWGPLVPGFRPPMYPAGPFPGGPFVFPRMPAVMPYHPFRPRFPIFNTRTKLNIKPTSTITSVDAAIVEENEQPSSEPTEIEPKADSESTKETDKNN